MDANIWYQLREIIANNKGKVYGTLIGFLSSIFILLIGFWRTLLILLLTVIGYIIGSRWDQEGDFRKLLDRLLPPQFKD
ncbi:MAG: DUF2273 domain-containing protein [Halanaerobiales bacterium]